METTFIYFSRDILITSFAITHFNVDDWRREVWGGGQVLLSLKVDNSTMYTSNGVENTNHGIRITNLLTFLTHTNIDKVTASEYRYRQMRNQRLNEAIGRAM